MEMKEGGQGEEQKELEEPRSWIQDVRHMLQPPKNKEETTEQEGTK